MFAVARQFVELKAAFRFDPLLYSPDLPDRDRSRPVMKDHRYVDAYLPSYFASDNPREEFESESAACACTGKSNASRVWGGARGLHQARSCLRAYLHCLCTVIALHPLR